MAPQVLDRVAVVAPGDKPMSSAEMLDEVVWLLDGGTHPLVAARMVGKSWATITKAADRLGRSHEIIRQDIDEWRRYRPRERSGWGFR